MFPFYLKIVFFVPKLKIIIVAVKDPEPVEKVPVVVYSTIVNVEVVFEFLD